MELDGLPVPVTALLNSPDDTLAERLSKLAVRQCCILPVVVALILLVVFLITHH
jgi:hypothetical protein